jgi:hypothetical protein
MTLSVLKLIFDIILCSFDSDYIFHSYLFICYLVN